MADGLTVQQWLVNHSFCTSENDLLPTHFLIPTGHTLIPICPCSDGHIFKRQNVLHVMLEHVCKAVIVQLLEKTAVMP